MVKLLLIFLISFNLNASTLVSITNSEGQQMSKDFDTDQEADAYISTHSVNGSWGRPQEWRSIECAGFLQTRLDIMSQTEWECPQEFTATKSDTTASTAAKVALEVIVNDMGFGKSLYAKIRLMNAGKSKAVRDAMRVSLSPIRDALLDGDICSARTDIAAITPDANITAQNLTDVLALIDAYKTCT